MFILILISTQELPGGSCFGPLCETKKKKQTGMMKYFSEEEAIDLWCTF